MTSNLAVLFLVFTIIQGPMAPATEVAEHYTEWTGVTSKFTEYPLVISTACNSADPGVLACPQVLFFVTRKEGLS